MRTATLALLVLMQPAPLTVQSLKDLGAFTVTIDGPALESFPSKRPCRYFEWAVGEKQADTWAVRFAASHSGTPVTIVTPRGRIGVRYSSMRLYLPASASHRYTRADAAAAPEIVRAHLSESEAITLEEFVLEAGRRYYARVDVETYFLPPEPGAGQPARRQHFVLAISDLPFKNGKPQRPLTPAFQDITY